MELRAADFASFFHAVHGVDPFPWQQALVEYLDEHDEWPKVLDLPTGAGKTAALDAAVFHLALRAAVPASETPCLAPWKAALRIVLVVDRRLVVDDAFHRAEKLAEALRCAPGAGGDGKEVLEEIARRLRRLAGGDERALVVQRLRGGAPLERTWARTPTQPTILCSTVDQVGSRLLFRGYGVSDRMKPVHAGLLGADTLILLDEVHLSEPFRQTLVAVQHLGGARIQTALLSATPGVETTRPFGLLGADFEHPVLKRRLIAPKPAMLDVARGDNAIVAKAFAEKARAIEGRLRVHGVSPCAVGIVVNRVDLARAVFKQLRGSGGFDAILMIGRSRGVERDRIVEEIAPFRTGAKDRARARSLMVVATQCLEVGVDLDLDGLVSQAAPLDALRQRFGRLNRGGRPICAESVVLARAEDIAAKADDPVYGDRIRRTWEVLGQLAVGATVDFGVDALPKRLQELGINGNECATLRPNAPVLMPAYIDLWSQTSPRPAVDPDVELFLHGAQRSLAGISIVWRGDMKADDLEKRSRDELDELMRLTPPRASEAVEVPLWAARAWLRGSGGDSEALAGVSDAPERETEVGWAAADRRRTRRALRWAGSGDPRTGVVWPNALRTGDMVIVPVGYGGCDPFGWAPNSGYRVEDVADAAAQPYWDQRCASRIARDIVRNDAQWVRISAVLADETLSGADLVVRLLGALPLAEETDTDEGENTGPPPRDTRASLVALQRARARRLDVYFPYAGGREGGAVLVAERGIEEVRASEEAAPSTEDDTLSHTSSRPVSLEEHSRHVEQMAERFARTVGLSDQAHDLALAAFLHDIGKADRRFQIMLSGGDPWNRPDGPVLAKSARSWSPGAGERAGLPPQWRHEALSVRMARAHPRFAEAHDPALVLWLIGTHHGLGRPFFSFLDPVAEQDPLPCLEVAAWRLTAEEPGPQSLAFDFGGGDWSAVFEDLKRRYGPWGLAHMEAILRLADHRTSEAERAG